MSGDGTKMAITYGGRELFTYGSYPSRTQSPSRTPTVSPSPTPSQYALVLRVVSSTITGGTTYAAAVAVTADDAGGLYTADSVVGAVQFVSAAGGAGVIVAGCGSNSYRAGAGTTACFKAPRGVLFANGLVYVADTGSSLVRAVDIGSFPANVRDVAGSPGASGAADGAGTVARFAAPTGLAMGPDGTLYVTDGNPLAPGASNNNVRAVSPAGVVTTLAGLARAVSGTPILTDGFGTNAAFCAPSSVVFAGDGNLYVADACNRALRRVTPAGDVSTLPLSLPLTQPTSLAVAPSGDIVVLDVRAAAANCVIAVSAPSGASHLVGGACGGMFAGAAALGGATATGVYAVVGANLVAVTFPFTSASPTPSFTPTPSVSPTYTPSITFSPSPSAAATPTAPYGKTWTTRGAGTFTAVGALCASADGLALALSALRASDGARALFTSADAGTNFAVSTALTAGTTNFAALACSADGATLLVAGSAAGQGLNVSRDGGASFTAVPFDPVAQPSGFYCVSMSADGRVMFAQPRGTGSLWRSTDYGATFAPLAATFAGGDFGGLAVSADGSSVYAGGGAAGAVYRSVNFGRSWAPVSAIAAGYGSFAFGCVAVSADGARVIAASTTTGGPLLRSGDAGATWAASASATTAAWAAGPGCARVSADGARVAAINADANAIYTSVDGGATLLSPMAMSVGGGSNATALAALAMTADGSGLFLGVHWLLSAGMPSLVSATASPTASPTPSATTTSSPTPSHGASFASPSPSPSPPFAPSSVRLVATFGAGQTRQVSFDEQNALVYVASTATSSVYAVPFASAGATGDAFVGCGSAGYAAGVGAGACFSAPWSALFYGGLVYVADTGNSLVRVADAATAAVRDVAGSPGASGAADGAGTAARFTAPSGLAMGPDGTLYVTDGNPLAPGASNNNVRAVSPAGVVTTLAGLARAGAGAPVLADGFGTNAAFTAPSSIVLHPNGNLCVSARSARGGGARRT